MHALNVRNCYYCIWLSQNNGLDINHFQLDLISQSLAGPGPPRPRPPDLEAQLYSLEAPMYNLRENNEF